jgi:ABC-type multidrug transport system ATPase subunit
LTEDQRNCCTAVGDFFRAGVDKVAVRDVSLALRDSEILAAIGKNGHGKSTTVRILTAEENPDIGFVQRRRHNTNGTISITNSAAISFGLPSFDEEFFLGRYGVCTQHDSLFESLTAEQHLDLYLALRLGSDYVAADWTEYIAQVLRAVELDDAGDKVAKEYSGGMKRKVITSIALCTGSKTSILDEPTSGIDSHSRRALWGVFQASVAQPHHTCLLVSHSLEEVEAVSSRIAMLKDGEMCCFGSAQHLKSRFGGGYSITVYFDEEKLKQQNLVLDEVKLVADNRLRQEFAMWILQVTESKGPLRVYGMPTAPPLSVMFNTLARVKAELHLDSYSVAQTSSLETIFIRFAGERANADEIALL